MESVPDIDDDFLEFLRLLTDHKVRYVVIGGYAVAFHGYPRYTGDMDIFVDISKANAKKLVQVFKDFGYDVPNLREEMFLSRGKIIRIGEPPNRLEVLMGISGVSFDECYRNRVVCRAEGVKVNFINRDLLLQNKTSSGRLKDLVDVEHLLKGHMELLPKTKVSQKRPSKSAAPKKRNRKKD
jgi:hypothetical protein